MRREDGGDRCSATGHARGCHYYKPEYDPGHPEFFIQRSPDYIRQFANLRAHLTALEDEYENIVADLEADDD